MKSRIEISHEQEMKEVNENASHPVKDIYYDPEKKVWVVVLPFQGNETFDTKYEALEFIHNAWWV